MSAVFSLKDDSFYGSSKKLVFHDVQGRGQGTISSAEVSLSPPQKKFCETNLVLTPPQPSLAGDSHRVYSSKFQLHIGLSGYQKSRLFLFGFCRNNRLLDAEPRRVVVGLILYYAYIFTFRGGGRGTSAFEMVLYLLPRWSKHQNF